MKDYEKEIKEFTIDRLEDLKGSNIEAGDLHNEIFNTDYYIYGRYQATKWLGEDVFNIISEIKEYEQDNFGEVSTDLSEPERVVNMYVYILGEQVLSESEVLSNACDRILTDKDLQGIIKDLS